MQCSALQLQHLGMLTRYYAMEQAGAGESDLEILDEAIHDVSRLIVGSYAWDAFDAYLQRLRN